MRHHEGPEIVMSFTSLGSYRLNTMKAVKSAYGDKLAIFSGDRAPEPSIRIIDSLALDHQTLKNYFIGGVMVLQPIPWRLYLECRVLVLDLNPRMPLNWVLLVVRRLLGKRTLLWGHAFPRSGPGSKSESLRSTMRRLSSGIIAYTRSQASQLAVKHPELPVWAAPNALYHADEFHFHETSKRNSFIYVGRLHRDKKPLLMIEAFERAQAISSDLQLVIVGDGQQMPELRERIKSSVSRESIHLLGHIDDYEVLKGLYAQSLASISPGYVGLSVTQSLSFGVPMIISRDEPHAPELEAVIEGENALFFRTDDAASLSSQMIIIAENRQAWAERGEAIANNCSSNYSVEAMVKGILQAINGVKQ